MQRVATFLTLAVCVCVSSLFGATSVPSGAALRRLLIGKWYEADYSFPHLPFGPGFDRLPHRMELTLREDGSCLYRVGPRQANWPASSTRGRWSIEGTRLIFDWSPIGAVYKHPLENGKIEKITKGELAIADTVGTQQFFRSRRKSQIRLH
jgi:hypothetical protein